MFIQENAFESIVCETAAILSRPQCAKPTRDRAHENLSMLEINLYHVSKSEMMEVLSAVPVVQWSLYWLSWI